MYEAQSGIIMSTSLKVRIGFCHCSAKQAYRLRNRDIAQAGL